jgi:hypothetical protein
MGKWFSELSLHINIQRNIMYKKGVGHLDLVASGKRVCVEDLMFEGEDSRLGLVVSRKRACAKDMLFEGENKRLQYREFQARQARNRRYWSVCVLAGYCRFESLSGQRVPNNTRSFELDRQEAGLIEVHMSSLV